MLENVELHELRAKLLDVASSNVLDGEDACANDNLHRLFQYPAMMVPITQSKIIEVLHDYLPQGSWAIEPFMGSGTALVSCMEYGFNVFGQDINPLAVLLSKAKTYSYDIEVLSSCVKSIKERISKDDSTNIAVNFNKIDKWFTHEAQISLSKIYRAIQQEEEKNYRILFWIIMSETIRISSNDRTSTFKLHQRSIEEINKRKVDVLKNFTNLLDRSVEDIKYFQNKLNEKGRELSTSHEVVWGNTLLALETERKFLLLVSSPPYGDNHTTVTYGQHSFLELQWIDKNDWPENIEYDCLRSTQEIDRRSLGGMIDKKAISQIKSALFERIPSLGRFYSCIPAQEQNKYTKTLSFILDFEKCLGNIVKVMDESAFYVWTIGNRFVGGREIPNDEILVDLMKNKGINLFYSAERNILNKKQARRNNFSQTMEKERILIFHKSESKV